MSTKPVHVQNVNTIAVFKTNNILIYAVVCMPKWGIWYFVGVYAICYSLYRNSNPPIVPPVVSTDSDWAPHNYTNVQLALETVRKRPESTA